MIAEDGVHSYQLKLPEGVELADQDASDTVSINIRFHDSKLNKVRVSMADAQIINVPEGKTVEILDKSLTVNVRSDESMMVSYYSYDIVIDASPAVTNGDQYVSAAITVRDGNAADIYTVGDYSVQIRVSDAAE